jgi:hypothetical protein
VAYPKRWHPACGSSRERGARRDRSCVGARGGVAQKHPVLQPPRNTRRNPMLKRSTRLEMPADTSIEPEAGLTVVVVYQDSLTRHWATELWDRVGELIGRWDICRKSWGISDLAHPTVFPYAVQVAAEADVLVISLRDAQELPAALSLWIEAWLARRVGRAGALVALLGVPAQPNAQSGQAHRFLETVARRAGLDFLPRERKLPEEAFALANPGAVAPSTDFASPGIMPGPANRSIWRAG